MMGDPSTPGTCRFQWQATCNATALLCRAPASCGTLRMSTLMMPGLQSESEQRGLSGFRLPMQMRASWHMHQGPGTMSTGIMHMHRGPGTITTTTTTITRCAFPTLLVIPCPGLHCCGRLGTGSSFTQNLMMGLFLKRHLVQGIQTELSYYLLAGMSTASAHQIYIQEYLIPSG